MPTWARSIYLDSELGVPHELPRAGSSLENPYVFDAIARELKSMEAQGLVEILGEHVAGDANGVVIDRLRFKRVR